MDKCWERFSWGVMIIELNRIRIKVYLKNGVCNMLKFRHKRAYNEALELLWVTR
jgi:hypothetical protein